MDVATTTKNFVDTGTAGKSASGTAEQLMGDFSAAVAERMKQAGKVTGEQGKTTLGGRLDAKTDTIAEPRAHNDAPDTSARDDYDSIEDTPSAPRQQDNAPHDRAEARDDAAPAHDDVAASDAPREASHDDAPAEHSDDSHQDAPDSEQAASGDAPQDNEAETQTSQSSEATTTEQAATVEAATVVVQQTGPVAAVVAGAAAKAGGAKAVAGDGAQKQNAAKGLETAQNAQGGQKAGQGGQKAAEGGANQDGAELAQKSDGTKGKPTAAQAQTGQNSHVKAETQAGGDKGATVAQQQAAELSKKVGSDQAMNVKVNVTKASEDLVSKPSANLAGPANAKAEGESLTPTVAQASTKGQGAQGAANNSTGQNGADGQAQNQQQAQAALAANAQAAKAAASAVEGKVAQSADTANASQSVKAGGAEGTSTTQAAAPSGSSQQTQQAAAPPPQAKPHQSARAQVTEQVTVQISKAISDGVDKIRIQLKPAHLGRVDVELQIAKDGHVTAVVSADNKDTLDLLKQDQRALERALREAGLNLGSSDLSFSMRGQDGQGADDKQSAQGNAAPEEPLLEPTLEELLETQSSRPNIISEDRVDITA